MQVMDLQRFAEEQGAGAAPASADTGVGSTEAPQETGAEMSAFQQLINGDGKAEYEAEVGRRIDAAIRERFKNQRDWQAEKRQYSSIMQELGSKFGVDPSDAAGIYTKLTDDLSMYREEADKNGVTPEVQREIHRMKAENQRLREAERATEQERAMDAHVRNIAQQAAKMKEAFPDFDLKTEMQNPRFVRMTSPGVGLSVEDAYFAIHGREIQRQTMQYTAQQAAQRVASSVRAGASRPMENGMQRQNPVNMGVDIAHMDKKTRAEYRDRIRRGEKINFRDMI